MAERYRPMAFAIETERLSLRLRGPWDAVWNLELLGEHDGGTTWTLAQVQQRMAEQNVQAHEDGFGFLAIERRAEGDVIGYCGLLVGRGSFDEPEIAYELLRRAHGHGYATEAARAVLEAAFATGRRRIWSTVGAWNAPSLRVLEKIGFRRDHVISDDRGETVYLVCDA
jgi:RimJ/RimL family protein N-acetyltransferase